MISYAPLQSFTSSNGVFNFHRTILIALILGGDNLILLERKTKYVLGTPKAGYLGWIQRYGFFRTEDIIDILLQGLFGVRICIIVN